MKRSSRLAQLLVLTGSTIVPQAQGAERAENQAQLDRPTVVSLAELVGSGVVSTGAFELGPAWAPDGETLYFVKSAPSAWGHADFTIVSSRLHEGRWTMPQIAVFSGRYSDLNPWLSPDGQRFYFASDRPVAGDEPRDFNLWVMEWSDGRWSEPVILPHPINTDANELSISVSDDGTVFFDSDRAGGVGGRDLYSARPGDVDFEGAVNLVPLNTAGKELTPVVSRDGTWLLFTSTGDAATSSAGDLYSAHVQGETWGAPVALSGVNTRADEMGPALSPDGRYLYFVSDRPFRLERSRTASDYEELQRRLTGPGNGLGDIYRILVRHLGIELP